MNEPQDRSEVLAQRAVVVDRIKFAAMQQLGPGFMDVAAEIGESYFGDMLVARLTACVYGLEGQNVIEEVRWIEPVWPRWMPKRLRRRWSRERRKTMNVTPLLVYPDARWIPPEFGQPVEIVRRDL